MTVIQILNRVLRRLREEQVTDTSEEYTKLLESFLSDVHEEVVNSHDWSSMDSTVSVTVVAGTMEYPLTGTNENTMLRFSEGQPLVYYYDVGDVQGAALQQISWEKLHQLERQDTSHTGTPYYFAFRVIEDEAQIAVWPIPAASDAGATITVRVHVPETAYQVGDSTAQTLKAPAKPLIQGVLYLALNERGEEMGEPGNIAERRYYTAIGEAIDADMQTRGQTNRLEFYRD